MEDIVKQLTNRQVSFTSLTFYANSNHKGVTTAQFSKSWGQRKQPLFIPQSVALEYRELHNKWKDNTLKTNTKVYSTQLSQLPSFKLKNYIEENKLDISFGRKWRELNTVVIGNNFIEEVFQTKNVLINQYYPVHTAVLKKNFSKYMPKGNGYWNSVDEEYVLIKSDDLEKAIQHDSNFSSLKIRYQPINGAVVFAGNGNSKAFSQYEFFMNLPQNIRNWDLEVVYDDVLGNEVNKGMSLDIDIFSNLLTMVDSEDKENMNMVKEIMANSEYEASEPYLSYIFNVHPKLKVINGNDNYKFLIKKLNKFKIGTRYDKCTIDEIIVGLTKIAPQYSSVYAQCLKSHLNHMMGREVIKEITVQ
jgi:hypothetical protein